MKCFLSVIGGTALVAGFILFLSLAYMSIIQQEQFDAWHNQVAERNLSSMKSEQLLTELGKQPWNEKVVWQTVPSTNSVPEP